MRRSLRRVGLLAVGACGLLLGCEHGSGSRYPPDPLLVSKKPIEAKPGSASAPAVARHEPPAPADLATALASAAREGNPADAQPRAPISAIPARRQRDDNER